MEQGKQTVSGRKIPKSLSGIETSLKALVELAGGCWPQAAKYLNPYQGLKRQQAGGISLKMTRRKIPKSLSGIETFCMIDVLIAATAAKYLNPYQGLKPVVDHRTPPFLQPQNT